MAGANVINRGQKTMAPLTAYMHAWAQQANAQNTSHMQRWPISQLSVSTTPKSKTNGAGSCHSRAGYIRAQTQAQCVQSTILSAILKGAQTLEKHAVLAGSHDGCQQAMYKSWTC